MNDLESLAPFFQDLLVIFAVSTVVVIVFHGIRQPALAGFILSGALVGPFGAGWIKNLEDVSRLSEAGVILLLFSLGVEFSLQSIRRMSRAFFGLGVLQCVITTLVVTLLGTVFGFGVQTSFVWGSILSLSSTAVVLKILHQRRETVTPHGQVSIAVLLFQDLWIIPIMALLPLLANIGDGEVFSMERLRSALMNGALMILFVVVGGKYIVPWILRSVARTQIRELFLIFVVLLSSGAAFLTAKLGLSLALGAFIAGVIVSESEYGHEAVADIVPFRDLFLALFFVTAGMFLDFRFFLQNLNLILVVTGAVFLLKFGLTASIASLLGYSSRVAALTGLILAQVGEFSFVLSSEARRYNLITAEHTQILLCTTLLLMALTPLFVNRGPNLAPILARYDLLARLPFVRRSSRVDMSGESKSQFLSNHVVIIGYGHNGQTLAEILKKTGIPLVVVEMNHKLFSLAKSHKRPVIFGDACKPEVIAETQIQTARMVVIAINDSNAVKRIALKVRRAFPEVFILARCHYIQDADNIKDVGVSDIVVGEYEMSLELFTRVLRQFGHPISFIEEQVRELQDAQYKSLRPHLKANHQS